MQQRNILIGFFILLCLSAVADAYGPLTHEAFIDSTWNDKISALLRERYPKTSSEELREARKYAYGGSIIQDMGYYPFGSKFFTHLLHYVRSADFIKACIEEAQTVNEYAFALGALSHYASDTTGHMLGTNRVVPILYPKLQKKFGNEVTFDQQPSAHIKVEFGYDVLQVARGRYASEAYHEFIGFDVSKPLLERGFYKTYGLRLEDVFQDADVTIGSFRHTVSNLIPELTKIAWELKKDEIAESVPGITEQSFYFRINPADYESKWGRQYKKPGFCTRVITFFVGIVQKIGLYKGIDFRPLTPETEEMFLESYKATKDRFEKLFNQVGKKDFAAVNEDLDTGRSTVAGEYPLADETYAELLAKHAKQKFHNVSPELKENILSFYGDLSGPIATRADKKDWRKLEQALNELRKRDPNLTFFRSSCF